MTSKEIIKKLTADGFVFISQNGSHQKWHNPMSNRTVIIPHQRKEFPKGTLLAIFKQAGWK